MAGRIPGRPTRATGSSWVWATRRHRRTSTPRPCCGSRGSGYDAADTQVQFLHNDGTGAATKIALGASFPKPNADSSFAYRLRLYSPPGSTQSLSYEVDEPCQRSRRLGHGDDQPASDHGLRHAEDVRQRWRGFVGRGRDAGPDHVPDRGLTEWFCMSCSPKRGYPRLDRGGTHRGERSRRRADGGVSCRASPHGAKGNWVARVVAGSGQSRRPKSWPPAREADYQAALAERDRALREALAVEADPLFFSGSGARSPRRTGWRGWPT